MSRFSKIVLGLGVTCIILLIAGILFLRHLVTKSFPIVDGTLPVDGLHHPVEIYRDDYGVPHIKAEDEHDGMFAVGFVHAQDRLWQMDVLRRAGQGRLSEHFGDRTVEFDLLFRTLNLGGVADTIVQNLHPQSLKVLQDYTHGVNTFIEMNRGRYPVEFDMLNYEPEMWKVEHSLIISRLIAWDLNMAWLIDLTYGELASMIPPDKFQEIVPVYPDSITVTVPSSTIKHRLSGIAEFIKTVQSYRSFFGLGSLEAGSNGWVIDSSKSFSGKPILANDPHLSMPAPPRWYQLHLSAPGWNVAGVSLPGVPMVVIGHNEHIAWGLTSAMLDDTDFYIERMDSTKTNHYIYQNSSLPMKERVEKIYIGSSDSLLVTIRSTHHGPIINHVHPLHLHQHTDTTFHQSLIAMRWTGFEVSDEVYGFYLLNRATDFSQFEHGLLYLTVPAQSVVYADVTGNIAYWLVGRVPIRGKQNPMLPMSGWSGDDEWRGFVPFEQLPKQRNPPEGLIVCANQKMVDRSYPYYLSYFWEHPSRLLRIHQLLTSTEKFSAEDFKQFQQDVVSLHAREVTERLLEAYQRQDVGNPEILQALDYLKNWDYRFTQSDIATTIFNTFFIKFLRNIFEDEMGEDILRDFVFYGAIPYRVTSQLMMSDTSEWFDNIHTSQREYRDEILRKSLSDALDELKTLFGEETKTWRWGSLHTVTFKHPFGSRKPLDKVFNIGPFPISGGGTTVNKSEYKFMFPYSTENGPSMRQVVDLADPLTAYTVITSGQSGQPLHQHYDDQTSLWLNGAYHRVTINWNEITTSGWRQLTLNPRR